MEFDIIFLISVNQWHNKLPKNISIITISSKMFSAPDLGDKLVPDQKKIHVSWLKRFSGLSSLLSDNRYVFHFVYFALAYHFALHFNTNFSLNSRCNHLQLCS